MSIKNKLFNKGNINLPNIDGEYVLKEVRKTSDIPIIMVTSKNSEFDESIIRHWKSGSIPRLDIIYYIAKNLNGSIDDLIGRY